MTLSDNSPAVRDAAVDLIGKYVVQRSEWAEQYYPLIAERVFDSGLGVRKRVVKLLRDMFATADVPEVRVKICRKLIQATQDEDDGVKDLALKSLCEILYPTSGFNPDNTAALLVDILNENKKLDPTLESALEGVSHFADSSRLCFRSQSSVWLQATTTVSLRLLTRSSTVWLMPPSRHPL